MQQAKNAEQAAARHKWLVMAAVAMSIFLGTIDGSIVNVALPTLETDLATNFATVQWVVLAYLLTITTLMLSIGRLGDMWGKKWLYTAGFIIFTTGSVLCGLSSTVHALIGFRVLQAVGAAMTMALGMAIVTEAFPPTERGKALGIIGTIVSIGIIAGPTLGGLIIDALSWHWIFFVNLPIGILGTFMSIRFVPNKRPSGGESFDFAGAALLFAALLAFLLALTVGQAQGFGEPLVLALFAASMVGIAVFITVERRVRHPMIDLGLFRNPLFSVDLLTGLLTFVASAGTIFLMPFYLQNVQGYDPRITGLLLAMQPLMLGIASPLSGVLSDRFGTGLLAAIGLGMLLVGYAAVATLGVHTTQLGYVLRFVPVGIGLGIFQSPNNSAVMGNAPRERLGVASGLLSITRTLGQITGISVLSAFWASQSARLMGVSASLDATSAPPDVQVAALNLTSLVIVGIIAVALGLSVWALMKERSGKSGSQRVDHPTFQND